MHRPRRVWLLFALFLTLAAAGLGWLTRKTLELDRAEAVTREQAEREERVRLSLWRMDAFLMPLLVQEASRPDFVYAANYVVASVQDGRDTRQRTISPLLEAPPEFVRLHFELRADGSCSSPQAPREEDLAWSLRKGISRERIGAARDQLDQLRRRLTYDSLVAQLPEVPPATALASEAVPTGEPNSRNTAAPSQVVESFAQQQLARLPQMVDAAPKSAAGKRNSDARVSASDEPGQSAAPPTQLSNEASNMANTRRDPRSQASQATSDLSSRNNVFQAFSSKASVDPLKQRGASHAVAPSAIEGMSRPLWVDSELILARRVEREGATCIQGCWLDWSALRERLLQEIADVLPDALLQPASVNDVAHSLATLPVQVVALAPPDVSSTSSPIRLALALAWTGLLCAALAAAVTLYSVLALSERRAAFVAAVTHELRTPLTTFRLYAEMLADGMVPDDKQPTYLETLRVEADRLAHLVDNVLQYARLERGRPRVARETTDVRTLVDRMTPRMVSRAEQAALRFEVDATSVGELRLTVDAAALEQILFNLVDNACKYAARGADARVHLEVTPSRTGVVWRVRDHGPGIPLDQQRRLFQPFSKTVQEAAASAPGVGLGLALSRRLARELGGDLQLERSDAAGTVFALTLSRTLTTNS